MKKHVPWHIIILGLPKSGAGGYSLTEFENCFEAIRGKKVGVIGLGVSNLPLIRLLYAHGAKITVYDKKSVEELGGEAAELRDKGVKFVSGEHYLDDIGESLIFRTPGVLPTARGLRLALENGAQVTSEMELFFELCPTKIIGITGSDGKTTTSTLISEILKQAGYRVYLGGNIGKPLLSEIPEMDKDAFSVVELSSFQLMDMKRSPHIAVITNVSPNHLDKHTDMAEYIAAKGNIFAHQSEKDKTVGNFDNEITRAFLDETKAVSVPFSRRCAPENGVFLNGNEIVCAIGGKTESLLDIREIRLPGMHNVENYMAAIGAVREYVSTEDIRAVARNFGGVPNRLEFVRELNGVKYYNSSIDSSPTRTMAALSVFDKKIVLIAGGSDKNISFDELGDALVKKTKRVILSGHTAGKIASAIRNSADYCQGNPEIIEEKTLENAVMTAYATAVPGDIVILSPACASFDAFKNFEERGEAFRRAVRELPIK